MGQRPMRLMLDLGSGVGRIDGVRCHDSPFRLVSICSFEPLKTNDGNACPEGLGQGFGVERGDVPGGISPESITARSKATEDMAQQVPTGAAPCRSWPTVAGLTPLLVKALESVAAPKSRVKAAGGGNEQRGGNTSDTAVRNHPQRTSVQGGPTGLTRRIDGSSASLCFSLPNAEAMRYIISLSIGGAQHWCTRPFRRFGNVLILCDF